MQIKLLNFWGVFKEQYDEITIKVRKKKSVQVKADFRPFFFFFLPHIILTF